MTSNATSNLQSLLNRGVQLLRRNRLGEANALAYHLLENYKGVPAVHLFAADTASQRGDLTSAIACLDDLLQAGAEDAGVLLRKAQLLFNNSQRSAALEVAHGLVSGRLQLNERLLLAAARIMIDCQDLTGARSCLERADEMFPNNSSILYDLALVAYHLNLPDEAEQYIDKLLPLDPNRASALHLRSALRTQTAQSNHVDDLRNRLSGDSLDPAFERSACYALAKEYEDLGRYEESFALLTRGAQAYRSTLTYDSEKELANHAGIRQAFTRAAFDGLEPGWDEAGPIFIVGMPRTGTTLVERLLNSHSAVASIGEFRDFPMMLTDMMLRKQAEGGDAAAGTDLSLQIDFQTLGKRYMEAARQAAGGQPFFADKLPYNFLYLGYIAAALPRAKLLHLTRDALDTCYAVYKTLFFNAYSYSYDLEELADYYISYRKQMAHWHEVLPGRILDISYEALVSNPEAESRRIVEWCGLEWEDAVIEFHRQDSPAMTASAMQVRQPFYTDSIGSWRRAGEGFNLVREKLEGAGLISQ